MPVTKSMYLGMCGARQSSLSCGVQRLPLVGAAWTVQAIFPGAYPLSMQGDAKGWVCVWWISVGDALVHTTALVEVPWGGGGLRGISFACKVSFLGPRAKSAVCMDPVDFRDAQPHRNHMHACSE